jgi:hypothetical protein
MTSPQHLERKAGVLPLRWASLGFAAAGAGLLLQGYALATRAPAPRPIGASLQVLTVERTIGDVEERTRQVVRFPVANRSDRPRRIVGAASICTLVGCLSIADEDLPLVIPEGEQRDLPVRFKASRPGDFAERITVFTDDAARFEMPITVRARVIPSESTTAPAPAASRGCQGVES